MVYYIKDKNERLYLRKVKKSEIPKVTDCVKEVYSGCYLNPDVFKKNYSTSVVYAAFNEKGKVAATLAFTLDKTIEAYDISLHTVRKEYRGHNLGTALTEYAIRNFKKSATLCSHPVTAHSAAQHQLEKCGLIPTGFLFNIYNSEKFLTDDRISQKQTLGIYVLPKKMKKIPVLYIPREIASLAGKIYSSMDILYLIKSTENNYKLIEKAELDYYNDGYHNTLYIQVSACGRNLADLIKEVEEKYLDNPLQSVILYLNINDCNAVFGYRTLTQNGYIFSGFNPLGKSCEYAVFFNPINTRFNPERLKTTHKLGSVLKELQLNT